MSSEFCLSLGDLICPQRVAPMRFTIFGATDTSGLRPVQSNRIIIRTGAAAPQGKYFWTSPVAQCMMYRDEDSLFEWRFG